MTIIPVPNAATYLAGPSPSPATGAPGLTVGYVPPSVQPDLVQPSALVSSKISTGRLNGPALSVGSTVLSIDVGRL